MLNMRISLYKILKNKIGFAIIIIYVVFLILVIFSRVFLKSHSAFVSLLLPLIIYTIYLSILFIKEIKKINYLVKYGIEATAFVVKEASTIGFSLNYYFTAKVFSKILSPWNDNEGEIKNGVCYRYYIDDQVYESISTFIETNDTTFLKEGSKINILANPNNKNESIIKELYLDE